MYIGSGCFVVKFSIFNDYMVVLAGFNYHDRMNSITRAPNYKGDEGHALVQMKDQLKPDRLN